MTGDDARPGPAPGIAPVIVVMGVSGCGKTTVGRLLAELLAIPFTDADGLHPPANIAKMSAGTPLDDDDRWSWLDAVGRELAGAAQRGSGGVIACSALKRRYRDVLRGWESSVFFAHLDGSRTVLERRLRARRGHFMPPGLLDSQLAALEPLTDGERGVTIRIDQAPGAAAAAIATAIATAIAAAIDPA